MEIYPDLVNEEEMKKMSAMRVSDDPWIHRGANMRCVTCMYFVVKESVDGRPQSKIMGRCRRHAPTMAGYPVVFGSDWCGDHKLDENKT